MGKKSNPSTAHDYGKIPPQAIDIEEAIIGALLFESGSFSRVTHLLKDPNVFYKVSHQVILEAIIELHRENTGIDLLLVTNKLRQMEKLEEAGGAVYLAQVMGRVASDKHLIFHCTVITDKYLLRELIRIGADMQNKAFDDTTDPNDIAEWAEEQLQHKFDLNIEGRATFKDALVSTLLDIQNKQEGVTSTFIKTGDVKIDDNLSLRLRQICLVAGPEGVGKTKYITHLAKGILDNNEDINILWFSMEDSKEQIIRSFISMSTKFTTKQLQSINYTLSDEDINVIKTSTVEFEKYGIEFIDRVSSIRTIMRKSKQFRDRFPTSSMIIIIDNLGLVSTDSFFKGNEKDDFLAGKIKELSDQTDSSILLVHHMTKETARAFNLKDGYRPRKEHIKGSTRILDYVQQCIMLNLPGKYRDLVEQENEKSAMFNAKPRPGSFDFTRFLMEFWVMNKMGDNETKGITDLPKATWDELFYTCSTDIMPDGSKMGASHVLSKYREYSFYIDDINRSRDERYKKSKVAIYTFINKKMFKEDYKPEADSRAYYLYGGDLSLSLQIRNLFIAEIIKNRDGGNDQEKNIMRYNANLDYNIFKPLIENK